MVNTPVEFIDISNNNGTVDFARVKAAGVKGVYAKASGGAGYSDSAYARNRAGAKAAGLLFGAYHFAHDSTPGSPEAECDHFLATAAPKAGELLPVLDYETPPLTVAWAEAWVSRFHEKTGHYPMLYSTGGILSGLGGAGVLAHCPVWVASWSASKPAPPRGWDTVSVWQYTGHGFCPGVSGECDRDRAYHIHLYGNVLLGYAISYLGRDGKRHVDSVGRRSPLGFRQPDRWIRKHHDEAQRGKLVITRRMGAG